MKIKMEFLLKGIVVLILICYVNPEGNVGCLFTDKLCVPGLESCFNDNVFGRCLPIDWNLEKEDLKFDLKFEELEELKRQLVELNVLGYDWSDKYTQCIIQAQLYAIKTQQEYGGKICDRFMQSEGKKNIPERKEQLKNSWSKENQGLPSHSIVKDMEMSGYIPYDIQNTDDYVDASYISKKAAYNRPPYAGTPLFKTKYRKEPAKVEKSKEEEDDLRKNDVKEEANYENIGDTEEGNIGKGNVFYSEAGIIQSLIPVERRVTDNESLNEKMSRRLNPYLRGFRRMERLDVKKPGPYYSINNYAFDNSYSIKGEPKVTRDTVSFVGPKYTSYNKNNGYEYVKGSIKPYSKATTTTDPYFFIQTKTPIKSKSESRLIVETLMKLLNLPADSFYNISFGGKEISFQVAEKTGLTVATLKNKIGEVEEELKKKTGLELVVEKTFSTSSFPPSSSSDTLNEDQSEYYSVVDMSYTFIEFNQPIEDTDLAQKIVSEIEAYLKIPAGTFQNVQAEDNTVTFKVPNMYGLDSTTVATKIDTQYFRDRISNVFGMKVKTIGIGDKHKLPLVTPLINNDRLFLLTLLICTVIGAICASVVIFYIVKQRYRTSQKLSKLNENQHPTQYQDLSRGRMMKGNTNDSAPSAVPPQRITSLSDSPSSRSSTSSWSEEPVTNMDITTGHMVLAYMEDHLTNKARLDMEWAALCAYEADPCSAFVAQQKENFKKNRYINALPYDHARIVLNALSNVSGSDYINASTITDHDPRNHAYIATQGPLENTVDDFWQMIWEQGCVVIVMLTRLTENDVSLCHRYWPLEGSELYHIYEVHLVSEHIWCDDFLVRSFYLKNTKTTETRTVTQFHFLTWMEGGVPSTPKPLLEFRRKVNKSFRGRSCPIVVHCSDGVGRTGSYLLLDMVLNRISKGAKEIDIAATLEHIRDQRVGAVSTKGQFQFILQAVAEEVQAILRALPTQAPATSTLHEESTDEPEIMDKK